MSALSSISANCVATLSYSTTPHQHHQNANRPISAHLTLVRGLRPRTTHSLIILRNVVRQTRRTPAARIYSRRAPSRALEPRLATPAGTPSRAPASSACSRSRGRPRGREGSAVAYNAIMRQVHTHDCSAQVLVGLHLVSAGRLKVSSALMLSDCRSCSASRKRPSSLVVSPLFTPGREFFLFISFLLLLLGPIQRVHSGYPGFDR